MSIERGHLTVSCTLSLGWTRCHLLKCTGGYLLIDTDYTKHYRRFEKKLANLGIKTSDIKYLLLTHHHDDHAGFAAELVRSTVCRVIAHRYAVSALRQGKSEETIKPVNRRIQIMFNTVYETWRKLRERGARVIYPSHGRPFSAAECDKSAGQVRPYN